MRRAWPILRYFAGLGRSATAPGYEVRLRCYASENLDYYADAKRQAEHAGQPRCGLCARVRKDQEKEGYSIPAQQRLLQDYALQNGLIVAEEFADVETAKQSGRTAFTAMLEYLKKHRATSGAILVEKTDPLYRNLKDWTTLDDLGTTIHLVKEARVIGSDSHSSDHLVHESMS